MEAPSHPLKAYMRLPPTMFSLSIFDITMFNAFMVFDGFVVDRQDVEFTRHYVKPTEAIQNEK